MSFSKFEGDEDEDDEDDEEEVDVEGGGDRCFEVVVVVAVVE